MSVPLSIVIPSYARPDLLRRCLHSLQLFAPVNTEMIVVDDGSPDGIISTAAAEFPGVRSIRNARSHGFCTAANLGIAVATGDVVELLNDDTEVAAGWADTALSWFANPAVAGVAPLVLQNLPDRGQRIIDTAGDEYDLGGFARKRGHGQRFSGEGPFGRPGEVWGISAAAGFYRRAALLRVGGFPEEFGAYFDDVDLAFRLRRAGYVSWYDPASVVWHDVSASYGKLPSRATLEMQSRNEELVFWRNVRGRDRWRYLPRHLGVLAAKAVRRCREGTLRPWLVGRLQAARLLAN